MSDYTERPTRALPVADTRAPRWRRVVTVTAALCPLAFGAGWLIADQLTSAPPEPSAPAIVRPVESDVPPVAPLLAAPTEQTERVAVERVAADEPRKQAASEAPVRRDPAPKGPAGNQANEPAEEVPEVPGDFAGRCWTGEEFDTPEELEAGCPEYPGDDYFEDVVSHCPDYPVDEFVPDPRSACPTYPDQLVGEADDEEGAVVEDDEAEDDTEDLAEGE